MAIHHGNVSRYLKDQVADAEASQFMVAFIAGIILGAVLVYTSFTFPSIGLFSWLGFVFLSSLICGMGAILASIIYIKKEKSFKKGMKAESRAYFTLQGLSDRYHTFQSVVFDGKKGDIDFVVIGPTGVFTVEIKYANGKITTDRNENILVNEKQRKKDDLAQAFVQSKTVQEKLNVPVQPILTYVGNVDVRFGKKKVKGVRVIGLRWLQKMILEEEEKYSNEEVTNMMIDLCRAWG